ncbi:MAG TPA: AMP-binding protein [Propionibacteriaceae bacterium]
MNGDDELVPPLQAPTSPSSSLFTNLADLVGHHSGRTPDLVALVQPGRTRRALTWAELERAVDALASGLSSLGLVAGHRVVICGANSIEFVVVYLAALRAGFVAVPVNPQLTDDELRRIVADSGAKVAFADVPVEVSGVRVVPLSADALASLSAPDQPPVSSPRDQESLAALLYTAGTSGGPKAAMLTHRALLAHLEHLEALQVIPPGTHVLALLPLFHVFGLNAVLGSWAMNGGRLVVADGYTDDFFAVIGEEHITNLPLAPAVIYRLLQDERLADGLAEVSIVVSGAAPLPETMRDAFTALTGLRVEQGYGLTEAAPGVSATLGGQALGGGHVGRTLPGVQIRIGDGSEQSEPGEIWVRGDNLFSGYWPGGEGGPGEDGWFATGDIGYLADEELFLVDRARELVIVNGFNVYPAEVEQVIIEVEGVLDVAVVGAPDARTGEHVVAFVAGPGLDEDAIRAHCEIRLAKFKRPHVIKVLNELPRGATGKILKGELRRSLAAPTEPGR